MLRSLLDLLLPPRCCGCAAEGAFVCAYCLDELRGTPNPRPPEGASRDLPECWSAASYEGAVRRMVLSYKERGATVLAPVFAQCLAATLAVALGGPGRPVDLVPVPSARGATRRRGHDPVSRAAALAVREMRGWGWPVTLSPVLRPARRVADQAGLSAAQRADNLAGAFRVTDASFGLAERPVAVLVDDVVTTGATLGEAARALRAAGAEVPLAITLAATRKLRPASRHARKIQRFRGDRQ